MSELSLLFVPKNHCPNPPRNLIPSLCIEQDRCGQNLCAFEIGGKIAPVVGVNKALSTAAVIKPLTMTHVASKSKGLVCPIPLLSF